MKQETINKLINHLNSIIEQGISIKEYQKNNNFSDRFIENKIQFVKQDKDNIDKDTYDLIMRLYNKVKSKKAITNNDLEQTDNYTEINLNRDENGRINSYSFIIAIKNKPSLTGSFTRDEMSLIYRLYSSYGSNITQREVSRFFPEYSLYDFKRILRAFNITKASTPFPQHIIEENNKETLLEMQFREKENDFLKSYEVEKVRQLDNQLKKYMKENADLKEQLNTFGGLLDNLDLSQTIVIESPKSNSTKDLFIWLSDIHIGAHVASTALYTNDWNQQEVHNRLTKILKELNNIEGYDNIIVCNLGDSLDGYDGYTGSYTHKLPQNMNNKEQVKCFIEEMTAFMTGLQSIPNNGIKYYAVGDSNHGCDFEYAAQTALCVILNNIGIQSKLFEQSLGVFEYKGQSYLIFHGKDSGTMFKNWPLTLNDKTENFINQVLDENNIYKATVVKGDLHQSATTYGKRIKYKAVGSLFGSSEWCSMNFGKTEACCDYSIIDDKGNSLDGRIVFND